MFYIKSIEIVLENCEVIKIDGEDIGFFRMGELKKYASVSGCNSFHIYETAEETFLEIAKAANNRTYYPFNLPNKEPIFDRLTKYQDITSIVIHGDDEDVKYFVDWKGNSDYKNEAQSTAIGKNGCLYLVISKNTTATEFFKQQLEQHEHKWKHGFNGWMRCDWGENPKGIE